MIKRTYNRNKKKAQQTQESIEILATLKECCETIYVYCMRIGKHKKASILI